MFYIPSTLACCSARSHEATDQRAGREAGPEIGPARRSFGGAIRWKRVERREAPPQVPAASQPDGLLRARRRTELAIPSCLARGYGQGAGLAIPRLSPRGIRTPSGVSRRSIPPREGKRDRRCPTPRQTTGRRSVGSASLRAIERVPSDAWAEEPATGRNGTLPLCLALLFIREPRMNEHVKRPGRVERDAFGLRLTDAQPLAGIPAVWRLGAIVSTLLMGFLAFIAALYFGRAALLPVAAALVVGITLSPLTEFGTRFNIPPPVSAVTLIVALLAVLGVLITFFAGP